MVKAIVTHEFDVSATQLWDLIGDFGDMTKWTGTPPETCVQEGEGIGSLRTLNFQEGRTIVDRLDAQTENSYSYSVVSIESCPLPYKSYQATMSVEPVDESSSKLSWSGEFEPDGISDEESVEYAKNMYNVGIDRMKIAIANLK